MDEKLLEEKLEVLKERIELLREEIEILKERLDGAESAETVAREPVKSFGGNIL